MYDDDADSEARGRLWRVIGAVISVVLVSEYILLAAATLVLRALFGLAGEAWRRLLPERERPRDVGTVGAEAADEKCLLRDHLLATHPDMIQPATRSVLLRQFVVTEPRPLDRP